MVGWGDGTTNLLMHIAFLCLSVIVIPRLVGGGRGEKGGCSLQLCDRANKVTAVCRLFPSILMTRRSRADFGRTRER